ncbi:MAG: YicC family protein [Deltaproteobacteria bacterium]|nr:YicC family protein [Deltaproteobacteria bacterium]
MTGHGSAKGRVGLSHIKAEIRSVNHRYLETNIRLPGRFALLEQDVATAIRRRCSRGKFDVFIKEESVDRDRLEKELAKRCYQLLSQIQKELGLSGKIGLSEVLAFRSLYAQQPLAQEDHGEARKKLLQVVQQALEGLEKMRAREGKNLIQWFRHRLSRLNFLVNQLERDARRSQGEQEKRLAVRMKQMGTVPSERVVGEAASIAQRSDVTEEIVRLRSHLHQFHETLRTTEPIGRKLDFLAQEIFREINTIGSKIQGATAVHRVIEFKAEVEKIREQIQNVE